ncbi:glycoside hydrolase family 5 protein [Macrolepiota fuliginosa MF-IS2]|uniref:glucan 1,3-beta-glucosidase n=1 Tax=Macrolepiota fuliginosa MF-IS2 TaxID=1400762 RepID=A0A9P5XJ41_9AGAR|nr:glycoside hydrolase family 5 protein [Macrolepiota fuliginosa MF-IS2]
MAHYDSVPTVDEHRHSGPDFAAPLVNSSASWDAQTELYNSSQPQIIPAKRASQDIRGSVSSPRRTRKWLLIAGILALIVVVAVAVAVPVVLTSRANASGGDGGPSSGDTSKNGKNGTSGSVVIMDDGTRFTYQSAFGGDWAFDPENPLGPGGRAQNWSRRIGSEEWVWGQDVARGVNLGGWLVTEPFISPALYEKYINKSGTPVVDEWTLSIAMGGNLAQEMEEHYKTFITEKDFADIAAAGLNWVRIPIGFWAIEAINDEPFLVGTSWKYFLKAIQWGRKYGIRIYLDLHALPGSQNGWNHSGKSGSVNFMYGVMGIANAQRTLTYLRIITQFVSQDQYRDVIGIVGIVNEILWGTVGQTPVQSFYYAAYDAMRKASGTGTGAGPYIAIHEGFQGPAIWEGFLSGADRLMLDQHPYIAFMGDHTTPPETLAVRPCSWAIATNQSQKVFGVTVGGEFSTAINDCGLWLSGIGSTPGFPDCQPWDNWSSYTSETIAVLKQVTLASMDALQNFFFWTWKIGNSTVLGTSSSPMWHYQLGLQQGWIPKDPREATGHCASVLGSSQIFDGNYPATATGGASAGTINPTQVASHVFPPVTLGPSFSASQISLLPTYTPTGSLKTLPAPTFTAAPSVDVGDGWKNPSDSDKAYVPISGCQYPDSWNAVNATLPTSACIGGS